MVISERLTILGERIRFVLYVLVFSTDEAAFWPKGQGKARTVRVRANVQDPCKSTEQEGDRLAEPDGGFGRTQRALVSSSEHEDVPGRARRRSRLIEGSAPAAQTERRRGGRQ